MSEVRGFTPPEPSLFGERVHKCGECGYVTDRDVAAAQVVEQRGLVAVGQTVILPVEEGCARTPMKQEASRAILGSPHHTR
jgi:putative transposase